MPPVRIGSLTLGGGAPLLVIAGPCVIESEAHALDTAHAVKAIALDVGLPLVFKASFDKANRTSIAVVPRARPRRRAWQCWRA